MSKVLLSILFILVLIISCKKDVIQPIQKYLDIENGSEYIYFNYDSTSYLKLTYRSQPYGRIFWHSTKSFTTILIDDTIKTRIVDYSTYADEYGIGYQMVYISKLFKEDTLEVVGFNEEDNIYDMIKIVVN